MSKWGKCDFKELEQFRDKMEKLSDGQLEQFLEDVARELAARLLAKVIKRTPVGQYHEKGKKGGTLRRGWTANKSPSNASQYVNSLKIHHNGGYYVVEITNPVNYASYVEYGHRKVGGKGWVNGVFMLTISEKELERQAPAIIKRKLMTVLKGVFK